MFWGFYDDQTIQLDDESEIEEVINLLYMLN